MKRHFDNNQQGRFRAQMLQRVVDGELPLTDAATILQISYRQAKRLLARFKADGLPGIEHGLKGKPSNHRIDPQTRQAILDRYIERYPDFGPTLAAEKLALDGL